LKQAQIGAVIWAAEQALASMRMTRARLLMSVALALRGQTPTLDEYLRMGNVLQAVYEPALEFSVSLSALRCDPDSLHARYSMVDAWTAVGGYERALALCEIALQRSPQDVSFLRQKASILRL
jgi:tetratricopeptide (TPR) repeat protein